MATHAAIVMPDQLHLLLTHEENRPGRWVSLSQIMQGIKSTTSHRINKRRGRKGPLWQDESYERIIRHEDEFNGKLKYICDNAAKAGLAENGLSILSPSDRVVRSNNTSFFLDTDSWVS